MSLKRKLYLAAALLLVGGLTTFLVVEWRPVVAAVRWRSNVERVEGHGEAIRAAAAEFGHDPYLLAGLMYVESGGNPRAVSSAKALGLMQLKLATAAEQAQKLGLEELTREDLLADPALNVRLGAAYLRWLLGYCKGDLERALASYNAGPGRVDRWAAKEGSWRAWRDRREAEGDSKVLRYARDVVRYGERFRDRGEIAPRGEERLSLPRAPSGGFARPTSP